MSNIQGLAYWENQMLLRGHTLVCDGFDSAMMRQSMNDAEMHYDESKRDSDAQTPSKFKYDEWSTGNKVILLILLLRKV